MSPIEIQGSVGSVHQSLRNQGILVASLIGLTLGDPKKDDKIQNLYLMFALPFLTSILRIFFFLTCFNFDTMKFYILNKQTKKAKEILHKFYKDKYVEERLLCIQTDTNKILSGRSLKNVCLNFKYPLMIGILLSFFMQYTGVNAITFYSNEIFTDSGAGDKTTLFTILVNICQVIAGFLTGIVIERLGRKTLFIIGNLIILVNLILVILVIRYVLSEYVALLSVASIIFGFGLAQGPITFIYISDILPPVGMGITIMCMMLFLGSIGYVFPIFKNNFGVLSPFILFAILTFIGLLFVIFFIIETKGKRLSEIWKEMGIITQPSLFKSINISSEYSNSVEN